MKELVYYTSNPFPYPHREDFKRYNVYRSNECLAHSLTKAELENLEFYKQLQAEHYASNAKNKTNITNFPDWLARREIFVCKYYLEDAFKIHKATYNEHNHRLIEEFKADLFEQYSITNNQKAEKLFEKVFQNYRGEGLQAVVDAFEEYCKFIIE